MSRAASAAVACGLSSRSRSRSSRLESPRCAARSTVLRSRVVDHERVAVQLGQPRREHRPQERPHARRAAARRRRAAPRASLRLMRSLPSTLVRVTPSGSSTNAAAQRATSAAMPRSGSGSCERALEFGVDDRVDRPAARGGRSRRRGAGVRGRSSRRRRRSRRGSRAASRWQTIARSASSWAGVGSIRPARRSWPRPRLVRDRRRPGAGAARGGARARRRRRRAGRASSRPAPAK